MVLGSVSLTKQPMERAPVSRADTGNLQILYDFISLLLREIRCYQYIMFGGERQESASYFCPVLEDSNEVQDKPIYRLLKKEGNEIRIRLDLAESLLARGAIGLVLEER